MRGTRENPVPRTSKTPYLENQHLDKNPKLAMLAIGALFAVFGFLTCRSAAVSPSDVLFLLGFRLDLPFGRVATLATLPKGNAIDQNILEVRFLAHLSTLISQLSTLNSQLSTLNPQLNDGTGARP